MDETKINELARRIGGRFRLASLVQKRLLELNRGQKKLVNVDSQNHMLIALKEIEANLIELVPPEAPEKPLEGAPPLPKLEAGLEAEG